VKIATLTYLEQRAAAVIRQSAKADFVAEGPPARSTAGSFNRRLVQPPARSTAGSFNRSATCSEIRANKAGAIGASNMAYMQWMALLVFCRLFQNIIHLYR
jgi:hypothetical protein